MERRFYIMCDEFKEFKKEKLKSEERKKRFMIGMLVAFLAGYSAGTKRIIIKCDDIKRF
jgi:hypothetical protein